MWQIITNSAQTNPNNTNSTKVSVSSQPNIPNLKQSYTWKHGIVTISDFQFESLQLKQNQVLITTEPFDEEYKDQEKMERVILVESGEENKNMDTVDQICKEMLEKGINKTSTVYIKGGGILLDMCGFACSIYMRGVKKVIYMPTTLLAIVDATVGGKTGVNWEGAKNMLGVISHPHEINIFLNHLDTLSDRDFSNGLAEVIKMSIAYDHKLFEILENPQVSLTKLRKDKKLLRQIIKRSLQIKIKVVQRDQFDKDERKWLNFGHTVGHAVELGQGGKHLMHGECVSIGFLQQIKIGEKLGEITDKNIYKRVENVLRKYNLPTKIPEAADFTEIVDLMTKDKKNVSSHYVELTLVDKIGQRKPKTTSVPVNTLYRYFSKGFCIKVNNNEKELNKSIEQVNKQWTQTNKFPSSKSLSIRYLFLSALHYLKHKQSIKITNFLKSDDTQCLKQCLKALGFEFIQSIDQKTIQIRGFEKKGHTELNVGNSGLTARCILPLCAYLQGEWTLKCYKRMSERPNQEIFRFVQQYFDCQFEWIDEKQNSFPARIKSKGLKKDAFTRPIVLKSKESSQFVSSILLNSYLWGSSNEIQIKLPAGRLVSQSYVAMTLKCLQGYGHKLTLNRADNFNTIRIPKPQYQKISTITIQQDLSSLSYPFALSFIHKTKLPQVPQKSTQGDLLFYKYCQKILDNGLPDTLDFSQCTDTFMTMAAILATNQKNKLKLKNKMIEIFGIGNQRVKQSNRIELIRENLQKIGYKIQQTEDGLKFPIDFQYRQFKDGEIVVFETGGDHRIAMSLAVLSTFLSQKYKNVNFMIDDKNAVIKTFPDFWKYMEQVGFELSSQISDKQINAVKEEYKKIKAQNTPRKLQKPKRISKKVRKTLIIGNRGSGKTSLSRVLCNSTKSLLIDLDAQITKEIQAQLRVVPNTSLPIKNISQYIQHFGWQEFRKLENSVLSKFVSSSSSEPTDLSKYENTIISIGGGVVDWQASMQCIRNAKQIPKLYIEKEFIDLKVELNANRPPINNFEQAVKVRSKKYEELADYIITIPKSAHVNINKNSSTQMNSYEYAKINEYFLKQYTRLMNGIENSSKFPNNNILRQGYIYCIPQLYNKQTNKIIQLIQQQQFAQIPKYYSTESIRNDDDQYFDDQNIGTDFAGVELRIDLIAKEQIQMNKLNTKINEEELMKRCRYAIAEFKMYNQYLLNKIPIILTLRTKEESGAYPFDSSHYVNKNITDETKLGYYKWINALHKIPGSYLDYQWKYYQQADKYEADRKFRFEDKKYILSYHGNSLKSISQLTELYQQIASKKNEDQRRHLIKVCYNGSANSWNKYMDIWRQKSDICISLKNPLSRLDNKYKTVIREADSKRMIDIPTRVQLQVLGGLKRFFR